MLDLRTIPLPQLRELIHHHEFLAQQNQFFFDQAVILKRIMLEHHETREMEEYSTEDLTQAAAVLEKAVEGMDSQGAPKDDPARRFLCYSSAAVIGELESRARRQHIKAVKNGEG